VKFSSCLRRSVVLSPPIRTSSGVELRRKVKRIFITGASAGIGLATARLLAGRGDEVWGTSRDPSRLPSLPRFHPIRLDLSDTVSLGESFNHALEEAGHFDIVINNAGNIGYFGPTDS